MITGCVGAPPDSRDPAELVSGGRLHRDPVSSFAGYQDLKPEDVVPSMVASIGGDLAGLDITQLLTRVQTDSRTASGNTLTHVSMQQTVGGVPIVGTHVGLTLRPGTDGHGARLLASSYKVYTSPAVDTQPAIASGRALSAARSALGDGAVSTPALVVRAIDGRLELVWDVSVAGAPARAAVIASGPRVGEVALIDDRYHVTNGTVTGTYASNGAPGGTGTPTTGPLGGLNLTAGNATATTDRNGAFTIDVPAGTPIRATLAGRALSVTTGSGTALEASTPAGATVSIAMGTATEFELAQINAYMFADRTRTYLEDNGFAAASFGAAITANVNQTQTCDAFYQNRTINFMAAGGMCKNSAHDAVVTHEYGHFVDDIYGGITDGGLSEGWGDTLACYLLDRAPLPSLEDNGSVFRTCDNSYQYPADAGQAEVHDLGQAWSGFTWHVRAGLIQQLGAGPGDELARKLVLPSLSTNAADIPAAVREVFLRDDNDGDLTNGTPHSDVLRAAAERHALLFAIDGGGGGGGGGQPPPQPPPGGGGCTHDVCEPGEPLDPACDPCVEAVCQVDDFCCTQAWDEQCAFGAEQVCGAPCGGGGGGGQPPPPPPPGGGDPAACEACVMDICFVDPYCCFVEWDQQCDDEAEQQCGQVCQ
ncbi:MAG TPA: hypothetical protein VM261_09535 [Kofleriaceae bacterium]|nr:hypothetical protein [Kofleriaceae bacterium]